MADAPCAGCKKRMGDGDYTEALGKEYHVECFLCISCKKPFINDAYVDFNGEPAHKECAAKSDKASPKAASSSAPAKVDDVCASCKIAFQGGDDICKLQSEDGKPVLFHEKCVICADCGKPISGGKYGMSHGKPVHTTCMHHAQVEKDKSNVAEFAEDDMCKKCGERIQGQRKTVPGFGHYHLSCFKCSKCNLGIRTDQKFYKDEKTGEPVCHRC